MPQKTMLLLVGLAAGLGSQLDAQYLYNRVLSLDGVGSYVYLAQNRSFNPGPFLTLEAWIRTSQTWGDQAIIAQYNNDSASNLDDSFQLTVHAGRIRLQVNPGDTYLTLDSNRFIADGIWHHVAGTYRSGGIPSDRYLEVMIDGALDSRQSHSFGGLNSIPGTRLQIGSAYVNGTPGFFFRGELDEVRLWTVPLSRTAIELNRMIPIRDAGGAYSLTAAWRFNGSGDDGLQPVFSGNARVIQASSPLTARDHFLWLGRSGSSPEFVSIPDASGLNQGSGLTLEAQIQPTNTHGTMQSIISKYRHNSGTDTDDSYFLGIQPDGLARFQIATTTGYHVVTSSTYFLDGGWRHVAGTYDGSNIRLYVNGVLESSKPVTGTIYSNATPLYLGSGQDGTSGSLSHYFRGLLDDIRIWRIARPQADIIAELRGALFSTSGIAARWEFEGDFLDLVTYRSGSPRPRGIPTGGEFCADLAECTKYQF